MKNCLILGFKGIVDKEHIRVYDELRYLFHIRVYDEELPDPRSQINEVFEGTINPPDRYDCLMLSVNRGPKKHSQTPYLEQSI